jgi:hypothetical protein
MADIRLKRITLEPNASPLVIQGGDINITSTTASVNAAAGALVTLGGIGINCSNDSTSNTAGGGLTVGGGIGVVKSLYVGKDIVGDSSTGVFRIKGLSGDRLLVDSSLNGLVSMRPDGANERFHLQDTSLNLNITAPSTSVSQGALVISGGLAVRSTVNATSATSGGGITVGGGMGVNGMMYVNGGISSTNSNTFGTIYTNTTGNVGINVAQMSSVHALHVNGGILSNSQTTGSLKVQTPSFNVADNFFATQNTFGNNGPMWVISNSNTPVGIALCENTSATTLISNNNNFSIAKDGTTQFLLTSDGKVGINTTSIQYALEVPTGVVNALGYTGGSLSVANVVQSANIIASSAITTGVLLANSINSTSMNTNMGTIGYLQSAFASVGSLNGGGITYTEGTIGNLHNTNLSSGTANIISATVASLNSNTITAQNVSFTNISTGSVNVLGSINGNSSSNTVGCIVTSNSQVGINTQTPLASLHVNNTDGSLGLYVSSRAQVAATVDTHSSTSGALIVLGGVGINSTADAVSFTSGGAITIGGGAAVKKGMYIGGKTYFGDTTPSTSYLQGAVNIAGGLTITGNQNASNVGNGGALTIAGGASVGGDFWVGGQINGSGSSSSTFAYLTLTATDEAVNYTSGSMVTFGGITIQATSDAQSVTNGGSLLVAGGGSFGGVVYFGKEVNQMATTNYYTQSDQVINMYDNLSTERFSLDLSKTSNNFAITRYNTNGMPYEKSMEISTSDGKITFNNTTPSTSVNSASLIISGGAVFATTQDAVNSSNGGGITVAGGAAIGKSLQVGGQLVINSSAPSASSSSGALIVLGGAGVGGDLNVGGNAVINGSLTVKGTTTSVDSSNTYIQDNVLVLNSGPVGSSNAGFVIQRFQADNNGGSGDVVNDKVYLSDTLPLQTGVGNNGVKLSSSASSADGYYVGWWIKVASGFNTNQVRKITGYVGSTRIATIDSQWVSQNPTIGDIVYLYDKPYVALIWNESGDRLDIGTTVSDPGNNGVNVSDYCSVQTGSLTLVATTPSSSGTTGALILSGGIAISNTTDASSPSAGGSLTTLGGMGVSKSLQVGSSLYVGGVNMTPNIGDQNSSSIFQAANNQATPANISGLAFGSNTWSFDVFLAAQLSAASPMYANFHLRGVNKGGNWEMVAEYVGDDMGIGFTITSAGQIQYTTTSYSGFNSMAMKWRALTN